MVAMQKNPRTDLTIYDLSYPCYVAGIPAGDRIIHIPGQFEYKYLADLLSFVIEAYKVGDKYYVFDTMTLDLWNKQKCQLSYAKRLRVVRSILNDEYANKKHLLDLPMTLIDNVLDLKDYCDNLLTQGYNKIRVMYEHGEYVFGTANEEYIEVDL